MCVCDGKRDTLSSTDVIEYLNNSFIFWSCSRHLPEGRKVFNALKAKRAPFLGIIVLKHARMTLVSKIEGPISAAELLVQLANLVAEHEHELAMVRLDREERSQNQLLRQQQDQAYLESLQADREKARRKQEQEDAARKAEQEERTREQEEKNKIEVRTLHLNIHQMRLKQVFFFVASSR